jgi:hypothetical protein
MGEEGNLAQQDVSGGCGGSDAPPGTRPTVQVCPATSLHTLHTLHTLHSQLKKKEYLHSLQEKKE